MPRQLPPLSALVVFEAAARLGSMSAAARELTVSQPAVSLRLRQLETHLGRSLFERSSRGLSLTTAGQSYRETVARALDMIDAAGAALRGDAEPCTIRLIAHPGFAQFWLMPRLGRLRTAFPDALLRLVTGDPAKGDATYDLAVRFGTGTWPGWIEEKLFTEEVFPVCAPSHLAGRPHLSGGSVEPQALLGENLLHMDEVSDLWLTWSSWFALHGVAPVRQRAPLVYHSYSLLLQAALAGEGIALGWRGLVDSLLASGALVQLSPGLRRETHGYHLARPTTPRTRKPLAERIAAWLIAEARS